MIREIEIANFQSLRKLKLRLGWFTVITGRNGSGKSALIRAVETLVNNARGTSYVTRGEKTCMVAMDGDEIEQTGMDDGRWRATIHRGGKDDYQLAVGINQKTYTKLAGKVPEAVSQVLRLGTVNFAGQLDRPFLLDSTGSEVARVLGKLTNVTLLYRAAQEANRRRQQAAAELKLRQADMDSLQQQVAQYATLPDERTAIEVAEAAVARTVALEARRDRLLFLASCVELQEQKLAILSPAPEPPSLDRLNSLMIWRRRLLVLYQAADQARLTLSAMQLRETEAVQFAEACRRELDDYTAQWGVCPACGQPVQREAHTH